jgi:hypothetical protein
LADKFHIIIIGGGIFGLTNAIILAEKGHKVTVVEKNYDVLLEASMVNQNRIHLGYHYPRSLQTGRESIKGLESFKDMYGDCIVGDFKKYYAIAKNGSHTNVQGFIDFCKELKLTLKKGFPDKKILNRDLVDECWVTPETIFDYFKLRQNIVYRIRENKNIRIIRNAYPRRITLGSPVTVELNNNYKLTGDFLINATYSGISEMSRMIDGKEIPAQAELCIMPILQMSKPPDTFGVTIMDGPFCSLMPKGLSHGEFILYHVTYSVLQNHKGSNRTGWDPFDGLVEFELMEQAQRYFPVIKDMKWKESWITTRVVLPEQELDDARPTLLIKHTPNIFTIFSGKLTTCVDSAYNVLEEIEKS